jgi:lysophosphatidylcholine acyltransferase/lyso-PAF acetyltransferase
MALDTADAPRSRPDASAAVHPLLSADDGSASTAAAGETAEELDAGYAPYARRDAYGTMGRGPLPAAQAARLALAAALLLPLRFVAGMLVLLLYYLVCRACTLFVDADEGRPRLAGWRRKAVLRSGCALSRAMLFVFGFYWIRETHRGFPNAEVSSGVMPVLNNLSVLVLCCFKSTPTVFGPRAPRLMGCRK